MIAVAEKSPDAVNLDTDVIAPMQARSRQSLERILEATKDLLATREFHDISLAEIAARAGMTVGAFYARFKGKAALLDYLVLTMLRQQRKGVVRAFAAHRWTDADLRKRVSVLVTTTVAAVRVNPGLTRAIALRQMTRPDEMSAEEVRLLDQSKAVISDWLLASRDEIKNPDPEMAISLAFDIIRAGVHSHLLFSPPGQKRAPEKLADQLSLAVLAYLQAGEPLLTEPNN